MTHFQNCESQSQAEKYWDFLWLITFSLACTVSRFKTNEEVFYFLWTAAFCLWPIVMSHLFFGSCRAAFAGWKLTWLHCKSRVWLQVSLVQQQPGNYHQLCFTVTIYDPQLLMLSPGSRSKTIYRRIPYMVKVRRRWKRGIFISMHFDLRHFEKLLMAASAMHAVASVTTTLCLLQLCPWAQRFTSNWSRGTAAVATSRKL